MSSRLDGISVLVTRPRPFNEDACDLVRAEGGTAIALPAIRIEPQAAATDMGACDWAIFVSRNAVRHGHRSLNRGDHAPRVAAVGSATAEELERHGFTDIVRPEQGFTSEALLQHPALQAVRGARVRIVRGNGGRELLAETLRERGASVEYLEVYRRIPETHSRARLAEIRRLLAAAGIDFVTVGSGETLDALTGLLGPSASALLRRSQLVTASERVVKMAESLGLGGRILLASGPQDALLVDSIANEPAVEETA